MLEVRCRTPRASGRTSMRCARFFRSHVLRGSLTSVRISSSSCSPSPAGAPGPRAVLPRGGARDVRTRTRRRLLGQTHHLPRRGRRLVVPPPRRCRALLLVASRPSPRVRRGDAIRQERLRHAPRGRPRASRRATARLMRRSRRGPSTKVDRRSSHRGGVARAPPILRDWAPAPRPPASRARAPLRRLSCASRATSTRKPRATNSTRRAQRTRRRRKGVGAIATNGDEVRRRRGGGGDLRALGAAADGRTTYKHRVSVRE